MRKTYTLKICKPHTTTCEKIERSTNSELETMFFDRFLWFFNKEPKLADLYERKEIDITAEFISNFNRFMRILIEYAVCTVYESGIAYKAFTKGYKEDCLNPLEHMDTYYTFHLDTETDVKVLQDRVHAIIEFTESCFDIHLTSYNRLNQITVLKTEICPDIIEMTPDEMVRFIQEKTGLNVHPIS